MSGRAARATCGLALLLWLPALRAHLAGDLPWAAALARLGLAFAAAALAAVAVGWVLRPPPAPDATPSHPRRRREDREHAGAGTEVA